MAKFTSPKNPIPAPTVTHPTPTVTDPPGSVIRPSRTVTDPSINVKDWTMYITRTNPPPIATTAQSPKKRQKLFRLTTEKSSCPAAHSILRKSSLAR